MLLPGWSTIIAGVLAGGDALIPCVIFGAIEILTGWLLIGWIASIYVGYCIYKNSNSD